MVSIGYTMLHVYQSFRIVLAGERHNKSVFSAGPPALEVVTASDIVCLGVRGVGADFWAEDVERHRSALFWRWKKHKKTTILWRLRQVPDVPVDEELPWLCCHDDLVGGFKDDWIIFHNHMGFHPSHWIPLTTIFQRGRYTTNQWSIFHHWCRARVMGGRPRYLATLVFW